MFFSESIINKFFIKNPELVKTEEMLKKHVENYNRRFEVFEIVCKWKLHFVDTTNCDKSKKLYSNGTNWGLIRYLKTKIEYFSRRGWKFFHISEMGITFTAKFWNMTFEHFLEQLKPMIERIFNKKFYKNPELVKSLKMCISPWLWDVNKLISMVIIYDGVASICAHV